MFSFHKPKVYRSSAGCCICKAKSSSSRFTDSKKYEDDFMECFQLTERRSGEICNACVLLVKRWKKLPTGSERNWNHVVDARAGPGTKSLTKFKAKNKKKKIKADIAKKVEGSMKKKHVYMKGDAERAHSPDAYSDEINGEDMLSEDFSMPPSLAPSPSPSEDGDGEIPLVKKRRHRSRSPQRKSGTKRWPSPEFSSFLDLKLWKREEVCCGIVFKGPNQAVMIDLNFWKPCSGAKRHHRKEADVAPVPAVAPALHALDQEQQQRPVELPAPSVPTSPASATMTAIATPAPTAASSATTTTVASASAVQVSPERSPLQSPQPLAAPAPLDTSMKVIAVAPRSDGTNVVAVSKTFSDSSSDSGYDESSNQGVGEAAIEFVNRSHLQPVEVRED